MKKTNHRIEVYPPRWYRMTPDETQEAFMARAHKEFKAFVAEHQAWRDWDVRHEFDLESVS